MKEKLKPVIFIQGDVQFYRQNKYAQNLLIKALSNGVTDPEELRRIAKLDKVADVYRTLDKLAIRKEYHSALSRAGVDLDYIVNGLKEVHEKATSSREKLQALQTFLKSLGLDRYEKNETGSGKTWEELISQAVIKEQEKQTINSGIIDGEVKEDVEKYDVVRPEIPPEEKKRQQEEKDMGKELYK